MPYLFILQKKKRFFLVILHWATVGVSSTTGVLADSSAAVRSINWTEGIRRFTTAAVELRQSDLRLPNRWTGLLLGPDFRLICDDDASRPPKLFLRDGVNPTVLLPRKTGNRSDCDDSGLASLPGYLCGCEPAAFTGNAYVMDGCTADNGTISYLPSLLLLTISGT